MAVVVAKEEPTFLVPMKRIVVTDLLLGLELDKLLLAFDSYLLKRYEAEVEFITMNMPLLVDLF